MTSHHLAQLNIAALSAPLDSPQLAEFIEALEPINALADDAPGFVWRLQTEEGDATAVRMFDDDTLIVNLSVWESIDALTDFAYRSAHRDVMVKRRRWFHRMEDVSLVLWWVPAGHTPTAEEAQERLELLRARGASPAAFMFRESFPPPPDRAAQ